MVGIGIRGPGLAGADAFIDRLFRNQLALPCLGQGRDTSLMAFAAADEAHAGPGSWDPARSGVFVGLEEAPGIGLERFPRMLQNRYGFMGKGGACFGDELGGNRALNAAIRRIQAGVLDGALVGAVQAWPGRSASAPAQDGVAVFLAIRRRDAAESAGDRIWAILGPGPERDRKGIRCDPRDLIPGRIHMVSGLLQVAAGCAMASRHAWYSQEDGCWEPFLDRTDGIGFTLEVETPGGARTRTDLWRSFHPGPAPEPLVAAPGVYAYAGATLEDLIQRVIVDERGGAGPVRLAVVAKDERERQGILDRIPGLLQRDGAATGWLDPGACFSLAPVRGKIASLFTCCGTGYLGMGRDLLLGIPFLPTLVRGLKDLAPADWAYGAHRGRSTDPLYEGAGTMFLSLAHAAFTRDLLGLQPDLAMGLSQGETNALIAYGAWDPAEGEFESLKHGGAYAQLLAAIPEAARIHWGLPEGTTVQWRNWTVFGPVGKVLERVAGEERAYISIVFSPVHCQLAGEAEACRRVLSGCPGLTAFRTVGLAEHTPVLTEIWAAWYRHHHRATRPVPGINFYSQHFGVCYGLGKDQAAEALTGQAMDPLDFPTAAWKAWDSGVRVFIEHGPRNLLTSALNRVLPKRDGLFLAMDVQGENSLTRAVKVAAELWCRGVPVELGRLQAALGRFQGAQAAVDPLLEVAASLFAASLQRTGTLDGAYQACLRNTQGRFLEFLGLPPDEELEL